MLNRKGKIYTVQTVITRYSKSQGTRRSCQHANRHSAINQALHINLWRSTVGTLMMIIERGSIP